MHSMSGSIGTDALSSAEQVERLILSLYEPNSPETIAKTQATLSQLQTQPGAWALARHLLNCQDEKLRFFGALTIIVRLNRDTVPLSKEEAGDLLKHLVGWYLNSLSEYGSRLVTNKLVSALSTFFFKHHALCSRFLDYLIGCMTSKQADPAGVLSESEDYASTLSLSGPLEIRAALWVAGHIADDATRLDLNSSASAGIYHSLIQNAKPAVFLITKGINWNVTSPAVAADSIKCLQSWVAFSQRISGKDHVVIDSLRPLVARVIGLLTVDALYEAAAELLTDALSNLPSIFTDEQFGELSHAFTSDWSSTFCRNIVEGDFSFEAIQFAQLLLAFADTKLSLLVQAGDEEQTATVLSILCDLLLAEGYPVFEDKIFVPVIEFWSTFAEAVPDYLIANGEQNGAHARACELLIKVCSNAWQRIIYPPVSELASWDSDDKTGFSYARKDVVDLLQSVYWLTGPKLLATFVEMSLSALQSTSWLRLEAAIYCIGGLADCCSEDEHCDELLAAVFKSSLFAALANSGGDIPLRARQTCLALIEQYTGYFERNTALLPSALGLLFSTLGDQSMAAMASKPILRLSSSCRKHLFMDIDAFVAEYQRVSAPGHLDCIASERIIGALSSVAQAIPDARQKYSAYSEVLQFVEKDLSNAKMLSKATPSNWMPCTDSLPGENAALHMALKALRGLVSIGRGAQLPSDAVDLEQSEDPSVPVGPELQIIQRRVVSIIVEAQEVFPDSAEMTEQICNALRTGFSETEPGPFVLPSSEVAQYLISHKHDTPRVGLVIGSACSFISSLGKLEFHRAIVNSILTWVIEILGQLSGRAGPPRGRQQLSHHDLDPEVTQNGIEFVNHLLPKTPLSLLQLQPTEMAEYFFVFTLQVLDGNEPLPKAAAAEFWATFVNLRDDEFGVSNLLSGAMETLGPLLGQSLARNIGGNASRSELDKISEPLKKLVNRHPRAKEWLENGLNHSSFPSDKVTKEDKSIFVKKVVSLRGLRATNQVVRDFWLAARGSNFAYAS